MKPEIDTKFKQQYPIHLPHLALKGLQPKTIEAYTRAIRRMDVYFEQQIDALTEVPLTDYFSDLLAPDCLAHGQARSVWP